MKTSKTKKRFLLSLVAVIACVAMLIGTTFAWFTDSVSNTGNKIQAGTLKIGLKQWKASGEAATPSWTDISGDGNPVFNYDLWEPGYSDFALLKVSNEGNLALKFNLSIVPVGALETNEQGHTLADVIDAYTKFDVSPEDMPTSFANIDSTWTKTSLKDLLSDADGAAYGVLLPNSGTTTPSTDSYKTCAVVLHMQEEAGNEYQNMSIGAGFDIKLNATQYTHEEDGFGSNLYDLLAQLPVSAPFPVITKVDITDGEKTVTIEQQGAIQKAEVPTKGTATVFNQLKNETESTYNNNLTLTLNVNDLGTKEKEITGGKEIAMNLDIAMSATMVVSDTVTGQVVETKKRDDVQSLDEYSTIEMNIGAGYTKVEVNHKTKPMTLWQPGASQPEDKDNAGFFYYDESNGILTLTTKTFSPFEVIASNVKACTSKDEIKTAMTNAKSGDTILINPVGEDAVDGKYYFGEGLTVPEGVKIASADDGKDAFIIIPHMYQGGTDMGYVEGNTIIMTGENYTYGYEIYSNAFSNLTSINNLSGDFGCSCGGYSAWGISGKILASDHIILSGVSVSHDKTTCTETTVNISFGEPAYSFNYIFKCLFQQ